jgi:L-rhamnose mutarotase
MESLVRHCLVLDLKENPELIAEYEAYHRRVWPEVIQQIRDAGIVRMEIYRVANRLCMVMEVNASFSFERKAALDEANPRVVAWEDLMWKYQQALPFASKGEKWMLMDKIFDLDEHAGLPEGSAK